VGAGYNNAAKLHLVLARVPVRPPREEHGVLLLLLMTVDEHIELPGATRHLVLDSGKVEAILLGATLPLDNGEALAGTERRQ
jgi:hypothetical protein